MDLSPSAVLISDILELVTVAEAFCADADSLSFFRWPNVISRCEPRVRPFGSRF